MESLHHSEIITAANLAQGIFQATGVGQLFGAPLLLAALAVGLRGAFRARHSTEQVVSKHLYAALALGAVTVIIEGIALSRLAGFSIYLGLSLLVLSGLVGAMYVENKDPEATGLASAVFPLGVIGTWFAVLGEADFGIFEKMAMFGVDDSMLQLPSDPWIARVGLFVIAGVTAATYVRRPVVWIGLPIVFLALWLDSAHNALILMNTPVETHVEKALP